MHITSLAPELSATSSRVCIWIMGLTPLLRAGRWLAASPGSVFVSVGLRPAGRDRPAIRWCLGSEDRPSAIDQLTFRRRGLVLAGQGLLGTGPDDPDDPPPLQLGERAGLHDLDQVPLVRGVLLVVGVAD